jgi:hypothetical protein
MWTEDNLYCECGKPATWVRHTQFSGSHPFCTKHAEQEENFGQLNPSDFFWIEIPSDEVAPEHKTTVDGYENRSQLLCELIHRMRYDKVKEFYGHSAAELRRQAAGDRARDRTQLATLLEEAASAAEEQQKRFSRIWRLCKLHMKE